LPETPQSIEPLSDKDLANLDGAREWVKGHFTDDQDEKYAPIEGKLRVIDAILDNKWVEPSETQKLQSLGVAFGDALSQALLMDWVMVDDEYGRSPALNWPGTTLISSPVTMISKRIEDGEDVDVYDLFESICRRLKEMAFSGDFI
jgi:Domain of unknown function (DUF3806)